MRLHRFERSSPPPAIIESVSDEDAQTRRDRQALERIAGSKMAAQPWPLEAMPPGTRVRVVQDTRWAGPWLREFSGVVDRTITPRYVDSAAANQGELEYSVLFDQPENDAQGDGPYRKAVIWDRYLRAAPSESRRGRLNEL